MLFFSPKNKIKHFLFHFFNKKYGTPAFFGAILTHLRNQTLSKATKLFLLSFWNSA